MKPDSHKASSARSAQLIRDYWAERGFTVNVEIGAEPVAGVRGGLDCYLNPLSSDMINGLPRKAAVRRPGGAK